METFQPSRPPLLSRFLLNPAFHIGLIFVVVFLTVVYIKQRESRSFLARVERMPKGPAVVERSEEAVPQKSITASQAEIALQAQPPPAPTAAPPPPNAPASALLGSEPTAVAKMDRGGGVHMKVLYAEVDTTTLARWAPRMQASGQYSEMDFKMGALPEIQKEISSDRSIVVMDTIERTFDANHPSHEWFVGKNAAENPVGFRTTVTILDPEGASLRGDLKMVRAIEASDPRSFDAEFELAPKSGWVFWDMVSRQYRLDPEEELNPKSFFQVFKSARFKNGRTSFTMFFIFDKPAPK